MTPLTTLKRVLLLLVTVFSFSTAALAYPTLQLDIRYGEYVWGDEQTIVAQANSFILYALLKPNSKNTLGDTYFISASVSPQYGPSAGNLGSFEFNGNTVDVTADMTYGIPPLESGLIATYDSGDLGKHGIFPTYFAEFAFQFTAAQTSASYNTQDDAGSGPQLGSGMYYQAFTVDVGNLQGDYVIHFDLYNSTVKNGGDIDITSFAPFSHDAESSPAEQVPEPLSLTLLATGCIALVALKRRSAIRS